MAKKKKAIRKNLLEHNVRNLRKKILDDAQKSHKCHLNFSSMHIAF